MNSQDNRSNLSRSSVSLLVARGKTIEIAESSLLMLTALDQQVVSRLLTLWSDGFIHNPVFMSS